MYNLNLTVSMLFGIILLIQTDHTTGYDVMRLKEKLKNLKDLDLSKIKKLFFELEEDDSKQMCEKKITDLENKLREETEKNRILTENYNNLTDSLNSVRKEFSGKIKVLNKSCDDKISDLNNQLKDAREKYENIDDSLKSERKEFSREMKASKQSRDLKISDLNDELKNVKELYKTSIGNCKNLNQTIETPPTECSEKINEILKNIPNLGDILKNKTKQFKEFMESFQNFKRALDEDIISMRSE